MPGFMSRAMDMAGMQASPQPHRNAVPNAVPPAQTETPTGTLSSVPGAAMSSVDQTVADSSRVSGNPSNGDARHREGRAHAPGAGHAMRPPDYRVMRRAHPLTHDQKMLARAVRGRF